MFNGNLMSSYLELELKNDLEEYITRLSSDYDISLTEILSWVDNIVDKNLHLEEQKINIEKLDYLNRCYIMNPTQKSLEGKVIKYVKVVSNLASTVDMVTCLCFNSNPYYWIMDSHHFSIGLFEFDGIWVDEIPIEELDSAIATEVTLGEYNEAMDVFIDELKTFNFNIDDANHF